MAIDTTLKPGDIGLTAIAGDVGKLIKLGEWLNGDGFDRLQHAFTVGEKNGDDWDIYEAEPGGLRRALLGEYASHEVVFSSGLFDLTDEQRATIVAAAIATIGVPYSFLDYLAIAAHRFRLPVPFLRRYIASTKHEICSQSVDANYMVAGVSLFSDRRWQGFVTPGALEDLFDARRKELEGA
jgi:hypothetical protein